MSDPDVVHYFTAGLKFPRLIGRLHDGTRIPGGPYTVTQAVGWAIVLVVGEWLVSVLHTGGSAHLVVFAASFATLVLLGRVKTGGRDPITTAAAVAGLLLQPSEGLLDGQRIPRPRSGVVLGLGPLYIDGPDRLTEEPPTPAAEAAAIEPSVIPVPQPAAASEASTSRRWGRPRRPGKGLVEEMGLPVPLAIQQSSVEVPQSKATDERVNPVAEQQLSTVGLALAAALANRTKGN